MNTQPVASIHLQGRIVSVALSIRPTSEVGCGFLHLQALRHSEGEMYPSLTAAGSKPLLKNQRQVPDYSNFIDKPFTRQVQQTDL